MYYLVIFRRKSLRVQKIIHSSTKLNYLKEKYSFFINQNQYCEIWKVHGNCEILNTSKKLIKDMNFINVMEYQYDLIFKNGVRLKPERLL